MPISNYALDLAGVIAAGSTGLVIGETLFVGPLRAQSSEGVPVECVSCLLTGGPEPMDYLQNDAHSPQLRSPTIQVLVRSVPRDFQGGEILAREVWRAIHDNPPAGYISCRCEQSAPLPIGQNENGEHIWSINVRLLISE